MTRGPRTAYSNFTRWGFKFSGVMTLEAMVRCWRVIPLGFQDTVANSSAAARTDRAALPLHTRLAPLIIFTGDMLFAAAINVATLNTSRSPQCAPRCTTLLIIYNNIYESVQSCWILIYRAHLKRPVVLTGTTFRHAKEVHRSIAFVHVCKHCRDARFPTQMCYDN